MKTIRDILSQLGYINSKQLKELAETFPQTKVVIQWGGLPRERVPAFEVADRIKHVEDNNIDYVRSVFLTGDSTNKLREVFSIVH